MSVVIWHNPRCSKSRETLALIRDQGIEPEIRLYLKDVPSAEELGEALGLLGIPAYDLVRRGEQEFFELDITPESPDEQVIGAMAEFPKLIQRPVVFSGGKARVGRPPRDVLDIL